jgi:hypothetical protein
MLGGEEESEASDMEVGDTENVAVDSANRI